ncbi:MAG: ribokinase, partial [Marmoricola sp.]|nr:ribokinase [Marmoricola sp.]
AAYAGASVRLCAVVGDDAAGTEQLAQLRSSGVDVSKVRIAADTSTGMAFILLTPDGENSIIVGPGANTALSPDDVASAVSAEVDVVLAQTEPGVPPVEAAVEHARRSSARLVLNAAPVEGLDVELLRHADPLVVNEHEAADLLREHAIDSDVPTDALARALRDQLGCRSVVVSLGAEGAAVVDLENDELVTAPSVEPVDTTGAGDVLVGVIAARLAQGWGLVPATKDACAIAARAVTSHGARGYLADDS